MRAHWYVPDLATRVLEEVYKMVDLLGNGGSCWRRLAFDLCCVEPRRAEERLPGEGRTQQYQKGSPAESAGLGKHCCIWKERWRVTGKAGPKFRKQLFPPL